MDFLKFRVIIYIISIFYLGLHNRTKVFQNVRLGLYNGKDFDFIGNDYYLVNLMKIVWRYGFSAKRLRAYIKDFLDKFNRSENERCSSKIYKYKIK